MKRTNCAPSPGPDGGENDEHDDEPRHEGERLVLDLGRGLHDTHAEPDGHAREERRR